ncbi:MAG: hypothetical protein SFX18_07585 [Pirellulales bacterium]|nr:hypothetical protein [Pirellulales bacterium]
MNNTQFVTSPSFVEYVELLVQLHSMISTGKGDGEEAENLRDQMDGPWESLTKEQIEITNGLSADLYTIDQAPHPPETETDSDRLLPQIQELHKQGQRLELLTFLRAHQAELNVNVLDYLRAECWLHLGFPAVAEEFTQSHVRRGTLDSSWLASILPGELTQQP